jgi:SPP1 gp7 family putative phage head morphogenesis protein
VAKLNQQYQSLILQIKQDADNFADQQMQTVYKNQKDHLTELHKYLGLLYITYAADGLLKVTPSQKSNILSGLNNKLTAMAKDMGSTEVNQVTDILKKNYTDTYYKNAYIMDSGLNINLKFDILKKEYIDAAVNNPIDGELFSSRIWQNKAAVADKVKQGIVDAMNGKTTIDKLGKDIQHTFNVGAYESQRLVNTENARVQSQAIDDIGESAGVEKQMYCATLEANTCSECAELDGQYFDIDDDSKPQIPEDTHPGCRCLYINVPLAGWKPTKRKDNESKDVIDYEDYSQWLKNKGIGVDGE